MGEDRTGKKSTPQNRPASHPSAVLRVPRCAAHLCQDRIDGDGTAALLGFEGGLFTFSYTLRRIWTRIKKLLSGNDARRMSLWLDKYGILNTPRIKGRRP
jgi:tRNA nucleotidyltransferase/poly(A) polymerase